VSSVKLNDRNIKAMFADPAGPIARIMEKKAVEVEAVAKALLLLPGSGRMYFPGVLTFASGGKIYSNFSTGGRATSHQASAPGEPPASDTGSLLGSVSHQIKVAETVYARVGTPLAHGLYLERGTHRQDGTVGMLPRPWLVPALHIVVP
jgi:hypothetical protein